MSAMTIQAFALDPTAPAAASAERVIRSDPEAVWAVLTDLRSWPRWNSDVTAMSVSGPLAPGATFRWRAGVPIVSRIFFLQAPTQIGWTGRAPGIRAVHLWTLTAIDGGTRVQTEESFAGWIVRLFPALFRKMLATSLDTTLERLAAEVARRPSLAAQP